MTLAPHHKGTIPAPDGSVWSYEIGWTNDARLLWVLRAPDKTMRSSVARESATLSDVIRDLQMLVARRSTN
jgi:hypothetical protein